MNVKYLKQFQKPDTDLKSKMMLTFIHSHHRMVQEEWYTTVTNAYSIQGIRDKNREKLNDIHYGEQRWLHILYIKIHNLES